jgi:hypothetical protein
MDVDQKHITTIRMHDAKGSDIRLTKECHDYQLSLVSAGNVVHITLAHQDVRKIWEQILRLESEHNWQPHETNGDSRPFTFSSSRDRLFSENMATLFAKMAQQMAECTCKR